MDFNTVIQEQHEELRQLCDVDGLAEVLRHLEAAEKHFTTARTNGDTELFTDVIYRCNQVFEGILKEGYQVIAAQSAADKTPAQIENYLVKHNVFRPRVMEYFKRYRQDWRNAATHDHRLDFDEQEAFLAYSTVCGFCFVAVNQMIQAIASQKASVGRVDSSLKISAARLATLLVAELPSLMKTLQHSSSRLHGDVRLSETALIGGIDGLIKSASKDVTTVIEPLISSGDRALRPDLVVLQRDDKVVVEVKMLPTRHIDKQMLGEQLAKYSDAAKAIGGVGVVVPKIFSATAEIAFEMKTVNSATVPICLVLPRSDKQAAG
jgi:hypothetical protein